MNMRFAIYKFETGLSNTMSRLVSIADRKLRSKLGLRPPANFCHCDAGVSIQVTIISSTANLPCCGGRESGHY